ncbi:MAG: hypothetical protein LBT21_06915 [Oscillospiraceae bacterium]|jgi:hypothetical protein|nr:hypothetical protein [Oscillospiraceae bacterium]
MKKKALSILLAAVLVISVPLFATAAAGHNEDTCENVPIIRLAGAMGTLYYDEFLPTEKPAFEPTTEELTAAVNGVTDKLMSSLLHIPPKWDDMAKALSDMIWDFAGEIAMDEKGVSVNPLTCEHRVDVNEVLPIDNREVFTQDHTKNRIYTWTYDWRLDPCDLAAQLHEYIENVKKYSEHSKVNLRAPSGAGMIVTAYLAAYGSDSLNGIVLCDSVHNGMGLIGQLACKDIAIDSVALSEGHFFDMIGLEGIQQIGGILLPILQRMGVLSIVAGVGNAALDKAIDSFYETAVTPMFFHMPNMWGYVSDEYYVKAKATQFGNDPKYADLVKKIDNYHYNVQLKADQLLLDASNSGVKVALLAYYGNPAVPLVKDARANTDIMVEVAKASGGATAARFGSTLGALYVQKIDDGHNHVSIDGQIDASTCVLPEQTWFIKNVMHSQPFDWRDTFAQWVFDAPGQVTVHTSTEYPQFMTYNKKTGVVSALTAESGGFSLLNPISWLLGIWLKCINIAVKFGTWWLPLFGIYTN